MDIKNSLAAIPDAEWSKLAELAKTTPEELQQRYRAFVEEHPLHLRKKTVTFGEIEETDDNCRQADFDIGLFDILAIRGHVRFCGTPENWVLRHRVNIVLFGEQVWSHEFTLTSQNPSLCLEVNLGAVKAKLCFGVRDRRSCVYISGEACYWAFGWHCANFDETILCLLP
jgi:hypothetical protein